MTDDEKDCVHCGYTMGEREGKPLCDHCGTGKEIIHDSNRVVPLTERIENLIKEAMSGMSARSKKTILTEALELVGDLK